MSGPSGLRLQILHGFEEIDKSGFIDDLIASNFDYF
jgi:hypothetical protein